MPEAALHLLEAVVAGGIAKVETLKLSMIIRRCSSAVQCLPKVQLRDVARTLIAEGQALLTGQSGVDVVPNAARTVIAALRSAVLHLGGGFNRTRVGLEVHGHKLKWHRHVGISTGIAT